MCAFKLDNPFETGPMLGKAGENIQVVLGKKRKRPEAAFTSSPFDDLPTENDLVQKYHPKFLGKGGENLVYEAEGRKDLVIKAMKQPLAEQLAFNAFQGLDAEEESIYVDELREGRLKRERERFQKLRDAFGSHVLSQKFFVIPVPVGSNVLGELKTVAGYSGVDLPDYADAGWTIVSLQKRATALEDNRRMTMGGGNLEVHMLRDGSLKNPVMRDVYRYVTDDLMDKDSAEKTEIDVEDLKFLMNKTALAPLLSKAERDPELAAVMSDFQKKAVAYSEKNNDILDIVGRDNIVFHRNQDGAWTYTIIDGLYPFDTEVLSKGREALMKQRMGLQSDRKEANAIGQSVNYVRAINGLGKALNTGTYIDFTPDEMKGDEVKISDYIIGKDKNLSAA